ncbi:hypothetical protein [Dyella jiangningensis]
MSDLWVNIRFGVRHLQIGPHMLSFAVNGYHVENKPSRWFEVYQFFGYGS